MKIIFAAGGTAGHINPALAVAGYIREKDPSSEILFIGTKDKMESRLVPQAGFAFQTIEISGFQRSFSPEALKKNIQTVFKLFKSTGESRKIIRDFAPDVVVGFGGYVSGPVLNTACSMGIPTCIHEQNAFPGVTNKTLAKKVDRVMLTVEDAKKYLQPKREPVITGLPVRGEIIHADKAFARASLGLKEGVPLVLSTGGSLGARPINEAMVTVIEAHSKNKRCHHIHSMGASGGAMLDELRNRGVELGGNIDCRRYIDDMDICLAAADLVVGRAGASSLSELQAMGKPSILIPSPYVSENHQYHNAMALVSRNAARIIEEKDLTGEKLLAQIDGLLSDKKELALIGKNARSMAVMNSSSQIAEVIFELVK